MGESPLGDNSKTMDVKEFSIEVLSTAVDFMYGIEIPDDFSNRDDLKSLLHMADLFLMENLKDAAGSRIAKDLNMENLFEISQLAEKFRAVALSERWAEFLLANATTIEDEKLAEIKEGAVIMASLVKQVVMESKKQQKRDSWMTRLFGAKKEFKRQEDFGSVGEYRCYVKSMIKNTMLVSCNQSSTWSGTKIEDGHVGIVTDMGTDDSASVQVEWLTLKARTAAYRYLKGTSATGPFECLDLLTTPLELDISQV